MEFGDGNAVLGQPGAGRFGPGSPAGDRGTPDLAGGGIRMSAEIESVPVGRRWLREKLAAHLGGGHPAIDDALQALSETLTNAVLHGDGLHVHLAYAFTGSAVEIVVGNEVSGEGRPWSCPSVAASAENGRGLALVAAYSQAWGWREPAPGDVQVWFRVSLR